MIESLDTLIIQSIILALLNTFFTKLFNKTIITASVAFWFGWILLLILTRQFINDDLIKEFGSLELFYIDKFHKASFIGFFIASLFNFNYVRKVTSLKEIEKLHLYSRYISNEITDKVLIYLLIVGLLLLLIKIKTFGLSLNFFTQARGLYNENNFDFLSWLGTHLSVIVSSLIIVQGINDGFGKFNTKKIFKIILYSSPLYLSSATRTFLIFPLLNYFSSFLLTRSYLFRFDNRKLINTKEIKKGIIILSLMLLIFSVIGFQRGGYGSSFDLYYLIASWPVSTSFALESWLVEALSSSGTNGLLTFNWFANFLDRIGLLNYTVEKNSLIEIREYFISTGNSAAVIPRSMLPELIFDFGKEAFFYVTILITFISQHISIRFSGRNIIKHKFATAFFIAMFMSIQTSIFSPGFVVSIFWIILLNLYVKHKLKKNLFN